MPAAGARPSGRRAIAWADLLRRIFEIDVRDDFSGLTVIDAARADASRRR
jgi:hypothetical protein